MTNTMILLHMLVSADRLSAKEMSVKSGLSVQKVYEAMQLLRKQKAIESLDTPYQLTEAGAELFRQRIEREARVAAKKEAEQRRAKKLNPKPVVLVEEEEIEEEDDRERIARLARETVAGARNVPNSVFSMGAHL